MSSADILHFTNQTLWLVLVLSLPPVLVAALIGTLVSLVQALTQIQEQTLGFVAKLVAVVVVLFATSGWLGGELYRFAEMTLLKVSLVR
ncbi:SctS family type III secretion system export apparatus subunit PscS [Pseudomonas aeruginosa]